MNRMTALAVFVVAVVVTQLSRADVLDAAEGEVDLLLVLAADSSGSMSRPLRQAQRLGFAEAFRHPTVQRAVASGPRGRIAVTYFEWAGASDQRVIVPWMILSTPQDLARFAAMLESATDVASVGETSISGAMLFAERLFVESRLRSLRRVVDISGNGRNSQGPDVAMALRALGDTGVTVNGLVLPRAIGGAADPFAALFAGADGSVAAYYRREVIGGPGAFVIEIDPSRGFRTAILRKLVMEIAWADTGAIPG